MGGSVTVCYWSARWGPSQPTKSLAGHVALVMPHGYASWSPNEDKGDKVRAVARAVYPSPRAGLDADRLRAGGGKPLEPLKVELVGLDTDAIEAAWRGKAAHLADPSVAGPPIAYTLIPSAGRNSASSCATLVLQLLNAGGAGDVEPNNPAMIVTPRAVYDYAVRLRGKLVGRRVGR